MWIPFRGMRERAAASNLVDYLFEKEAQSFGSGFKVAAKSRGMIQVSLGAADEKRRAEVTNDLIRHVEGTVLKGHVEVKPEETRGDQTINIVPAAGSKRGKPIFNRLFELVLSRKNKQATKRA